MIQLVPPIVVLWSTPEPTMAVRVKATQQRKFVLRAVLHKFFKFGVDFPFLDVQVNGRKDERV